MSRAPRADGSPPARVLFARDDDDLRIQHADLAERLEQRRSESRSGDVRGVGQRRSGDDAPDIVGLEEAGSRLALRSGPLPLDVDDAVSGDLADLAPFLGYQAPVYRSFAPPTRTRSFSSR